MKAGVRAVGVAESYTGAQSVLAAAIVRADRTVDGFGVDTCTVGGLDASERIGRLLDRTLREDVRYVLIAGVAPAWYNVIDLHAIHETAERPVCAITFEDSSGLEGAIEAAFDGTAREERLERYRRLPERVPTTVNDESIHLRALGLPPDEAAAMVDAFTPVGGRPEPLRVARLLARAVDRWRADS